MRCAYFIVLAVVNASLVAGCSEVTDLYKYETLDSSEDAAITDASEVAQPDADPACSPDPCAIYNKVCVGGFCGGCLPGYALNPITELCEESDDPCNPDPCAAQFRLCVDGSCAGCADGYVEEGGVCVSSGDPCAPDPCISANKICVEGFCDGCIPGFIAQGGQCVAPNACLPNPCVEEFKTTCTEDPEGLPVCLCDPGAKDDGNGGCTFDPCIPDPCTDQTVFTRCESVGPLFQCVCPSGQIPEGDGCIADPCDPNPCTGNKNVCTADAGQAVCSCKLGFQENDTQNCVESLATNLGQADFEDLVDVSETIDDGRQLFLDDFRIDLLNNMQRRVHSATRESTSYEIDHDLQTAEIGRARGGSLVFVPEDFRDALADDNPLKSWAWRQYYVGYRQLWTTENQYGWLCVAVANSPLGPWTKPTIAADSDAPNCLLLDDGIIYAEVTATPSGFVASVTRTAAGSAATDPGVYVYTSDDGVAWSASSGAVIALSTNPSSNEQYGRVGERSRLVWDEATGSWLGLVSLTAPTGANARGVMLGGADPASGWTKNPGVNGAPAITGPTTAEIQQSIGYGDMTAWREGSVWIGLVQKDLNTCPKTSTASLVTSRDGRYWQHVVDDVNPGAEVFLTTGANGVDASVDSLVGGAPAALDGQWHFYAGGLEVTICDAQESPTGGIYRSSIRIGGLASMEPIDPASPAVLLTKPMSLADGVNGAALTLNARVDGKLTIAVEKLSPIDTVLKATEKVVLAGEYIEQTLDMESLEPFTGDRFRLRFVFENGGGALYGFMVGDPACNPNPCTEDPEKTTCESNGTAYTCVCTAPLHPDGAGGCTDDPCIPDPCTGPNETSCFDDGGVAECNCSEGFVRFDGSCIPDPCLGNPCLPPENKCRVEGGQATCFCPEGSEPSPSGCVESPGSMKAFVAQLALDGANGGPAAVDEVCSSQALAAGLNGTFVAWLSSSATPAATRVVTGGPWRTYDSAMNLWTRLVALSTADLTDGELSSPIDATPFGTSADPSCQVWTGTSPAGQPAPSFGPFGTNCEEWSSAIPSATGLAGNCNATDATWTSAGPVSCASKLFVYCLQIP